MNVDIENPNPQIFIKTNKTDLNRQINEKQNIEDEVDKEEIYDIIKNINDPEHPYTLEQLKIVSRDLISIDGCNVNVFFTPTIPNCSMSTLIGLLIKVKLIFSLSAKYKINVFIEPGKHLTEDSINKQLQDKERVFAAYENENVKKVLFKGIENDLDIQAFIESL